MRFFKSFSIFS